MYPRKTILSSQDALVHVISRCHDRNYFLEPVNIKNKVLLTWAKYKKKYGIRIYAYSIMDNHFHAIMRAPNAEMLGHFMRTTNSQIAQYINRHFERDSQAFRERYKSPLISNLKYLCDCMKYIFSNRTRVNRNIRPENDRFCSAYWNLNPRVAHQNPKSKEEKEHNQLADLLDDISELEELSLSESSIFIKELARQAFEEVFKLAQSVFEHSHSICDAVVMKYRIELLNAYRRQRGPPVTYIGPAYWKA